MYKHLFISVFLLIISAVNVEAQITLTTSSGDGAFNINGTDPVVIDQGITVTGSVTISAASVMITDGFVLAEDLLIYPSHLYGVVGSYNTQTGVLSLDGNGTTAQYQEILRTIQYNNTNSTPSLISRGIIFSLGSALPFYPCGHDAPHFYEYIEENATDWYAARTAAEAKRYFGLQGYLATIMCNDENNFIISKLNASAFIGASDDPATCSTCSGIEEWDWFWVTGPEKGTQFWNEHNNFPMPPNYYKWFPGNAAYPTPEPNNFDGQEHYAVIYGTLVPPWGATGYWNDVRRTPNPAGSLYDDMVRGYVVEYGEMPGDPEVATSGKKIVRMTEFTGEAGPISEDDFVCAGTQVLYYITPVSGANSYIWQYTGTGVTISEDDANAQATLTFATAATAGTLTVTPFQGTAQGGVSPNFNITVGYAPVMSGTISGVASVCIPEDNLNYTIESVTSALTYSWTYSGTGVSLTPNSNQVEIDFSSSATSGTLTVNCSNACGTSENSSPISISIVDIQPIITTVVTDETVCKGASAEIGLESSISGVNYAAFLGTTQIGSVTGTGAALSLNVPASVLSIGNNSVTFVGTLGSCTENLNNPSTINVVQYPDNTIIPTGSSVCEGEAGSVTLTTGQAGVTYEAFLNGTSLGTSVGASASFSLPANLIENGDNQIEIHADNGTCNNILQNNAIVTLNGFDISEIATVGDTVAQGANGIITFAVTENNITYEIYPQNETDIVESIVGNGEGMLSQILAAELLPGINTFDIFAKNGTCKLFIGIETIKVLEDITIPDAFSPNGNSINDVLIIRGIEEYPNNTVQIFNRWGALIYETELYNNNDIVWDGTSQNGMNTGDGILPEGTYFYIIKLGIDDSVYTGSLYLNK